MLNQKKKVLGNGHDTNTSVTKKQVFKTDIRKKRKKRTSKDGVCLE